MKGLESLGVSQSSVPERVPRGGWEAGGLGKLDRTYVRTK